jgi:acylphosphatase
MASRVRAHVFVRGRVQGVFFRQNTQHQAEILGVKGWVRNLPDGSVEAIFEGDETSVNRIVEYCRHGPSPAKVQNFEVRYENHSGKFEGFTILV